MRSYHGRCLVTVVLLNALCSSPALAQQPKAGVVTTLQGQATVARPVIPQPIPLKFKDDVFAQDRIDTREDSIVRVLLGGKALVTIRELSTFTITEEPGRAVVELQSGKAAVAVARRLLGPGQALEVRTPNAVAAVRGTLGVVTTRVVAGTPVTEVAVLEGVFTTSHRGSHLPPVEVRAGQLLAIRGDVLEPLRRLTDAEIRPLRRDAKGPKPREQSEKFPETAAAAILNVQFEQSTALAETLLLAPGQIVVTVPSPTPPPPDTSTADICANCVPISKEAGPNLLIKNGGFETGDFTDWTLSGAGSVVSALGSFTAPEGSKMALIHTGTGAVNVLGCSSGNPCQKSTLTQSFSVGSTLLIKFNYNFFSNEFPFQSTSFNDFFEAKLTDSAGSTTQLAFESRNSSTFTLATTSMSAGGFTLASGNGFTGFKSASKTVVASSGLATLSFEVADVSDSVVDSAALIDAVVVTQDPPLYLVRDGQTLTTPSGTPLVEVANGTLTADSVLIVCCPGLAGPSSAKLGGPVLKATRSALTVPFSLLGLLEGQTLTTTSSDPLVWLEQGTHALSTVPGTAIFDFWGVRTAQDAETGLTLGSDSLVQHSGVFLESSGATVTTQKLLKLDTALLEATAPLLNLTAGSTFTTSADAIDLSFRAKVTSLGPLIALDRSTMTILSGAAVNVAGGSVLKVTGDLIQLSNGSTLNLLNGPLLSVSGSSVANISGALVAFGGSGGNKVSITNSLCPCVEIGGLPVALQGGALASNVSVASPVKSPGLGSLSLSSNAAAVLVQGATSKVTIAGK